MDKPVFDKGLVLPDELICLSKTCVSNAQGLPWSMLMPSPRGRYKIANAPPPGATTWANAPRLPGGNVHRWNWLMHNVITQCHFEGAQRAWATCSTEWPYRMTIRKLSTDIILVCQKILGGLGKHFKLYFAAPIKCIKETFREGHCMLKELKVFRIKV